MAGEPDYSILSAFQGPITRPKTSLFYHAGMLLVAGTMLLLPVIYVALVGIVAYGVYYHAVHHWGPIMDSGLGVIVKLLAYFTPLLAGSIVVFFMFKPLLARRPKGAQPLALNPATERLLYAFIEKICDIVGAPSPKRIDLDCQLNAAASFRRGFFSMFGDDLVLVLGLPLVANLTAREFAGVIAHEFGHFTQSAGMRVNYIINRVNFWFARVAYERDSWDVALEQWAAEVRDGRVALIVWTIQLSVWFSRLILKLLMLIGITVSGFMMRQMEYDADAYEIKVAGSDCFERTMRKLATLEAAWGETRKQLVASWQKNRTLPDNLPHLIRTSHEALPETVLRKIDDTLGLRRTGLFDSHPSPADRIRQARKAAEPGIFEDERPASSLFASFEHPSRFVTLLHYTDDIGLPITEQMLTHVGAEANAPTGVTVSPVTTHLCPTYFLGILPLLKPLRLKVPRASGKIEADYTELTRLTAALREVAERLETYGEQDAKLLERLTSLRAAEALIENGFVLTEGTFGLSEITSESLATDKSGAVQARADLRHSLREVGAILTQRLELGLSLALANVGETASSNGVEAIPKLVSSVNEQAEVYPQRQKLAEALLTLSRIKALRSSEGENAAMGRALAAQEAVVNKLAAKLAKQSVPERNSETGPRLRIAKSNSDFDSIEKQNQEWFQAYDRALEELVQFAAPAESFAPA